MDKLNFEDQSVQLLIASDSINDTYPISHLPKKLVEPTTEKGKRCLFEEIDSNIYEEEARMVAFRTTCGRIQAWLKALNILYYEFYGKQQDKDISWVDNPQSLSEGQILKSLTVDLKSANDNKLLYKITFFIKTGLIQCQGVHHEKFMNNDFPQLLSLVKQITGTSLNEQSTTQSVKRDETSLKGASTEDDTEQAKPSVKQKQTDSNCNVQTKTDENGNYSEHFNRLQIGLTETVTKIKHSNIDNTERILEAISNCEMSIKNIPSNIKQLKLTAVETVQSSEVAALKTKVKSLEEANQSLEGHLQREKSNLILLKEQFDSSIKHEREILADTRTQMKLMVSSANEELELKSKRLDERNEEITELTASLDTLKTKLNDAQDEIIHLKSQILTIPDTDKSLEALKTAKSKETHQQKPKLLLLGTSNIEGINEQKLTSAADVHKVIRYTLDATYEYISTYPDTPDILVLHSLTNDIKSTHPTQCLDKLSRVITKATSKWPLLKCIISLTTPRKDNMSNSTNAQILNVLIKQKFIGVDNLYFADHTNMLVNGNPNDNLLCEDRYHLSEKGISLLASNIKRAIHVALDIPLPPTRSRSRSRQRQHKGRGRGRGYTE